MLFKPVANSTVRCLVNPSRRGLSSTALKKPAPFTGRDLGTFAVLYLCFLGPLEHYYFSQKKEAKAADASASQH